MGEVADLQHQQLFLRVPLRCLLLSSTPFFQRQDASRAHPVLSGPGFPGVCLKPGIWSEGMASSQTAVSAGLELAVHRRQRLDHRAGPGETELGRALALQRAGH